MCDSPVDQEMDSMNSTSPITNRKETVAICESQNPNTKKNKSKRIMIMCVLLAIGGITCCIVGVVYFEKARQLSDSSKNEQNQKTGPDTKQSGKPENGGTCALSKEVQSSGLVKFFNKVENAYFKLHPHEIPYKYGVTREEIVLNYHWYDPKPATIKAITDAAESLSQELKKLNIRRELLKPREAKVLSSVEHFLEQNFGSAYDNGYYTGEWMLGPSRFCYMQLLSKLQFSFKAFLFKIQPRTVEDIELITKVLKGMRDGINQYRQNLEMGVKVGMVNSIEECIAGYDCLVNEFPFIGSDPSPENILKEHAGIMFVNQHVYELWFKNATEPWRRKYGTSLVSFLKDVAVENLGKPLADLFLYLSGDYRNHCVPSNVSSGLATRPVSYVYTNGVANLSQPTTQTLPTGEKANGKKAYERIIRFFTTTNSTPDEVHELGWKVLRTLYPQVIEIAKIVTNKENEVQAVVNFRKYINSSEMYFNKEPFPANESDEHAHKFCSKMSSAKILCPVRYKTLQEWFSYTRSTLSMLRPRILHMFYWLVGPKKTTPVCPVSMQANFQPTSASQSYRPSGPTCHFPGTYFVPFFLDRMGPKYSEWSVNAHEALPGHHLQSQGRFENFLRNDKCVPLLGALIRSQYSNEAFTEGWALYAEDPLIAKDTNTYDGEPLQKYGMLKWQIWRALRLIVDTGVHYKGMTRQEALKLFSEYAWDDSDVAQKEMTRYQSGPGQATAYMIGQRAIINMRKKAEQKLGSKFNLKDFHYYILSCSPAPLKFVAHQIDRYIDCELDSQGPGCEHFLVNTTKSMTSSNANKQYSILDDETLNAPGIHEL
ncbi:uncharacterized protein LOC116297485 [Actinia tenebrosa]|uniref:Uncharacterized protein LOC116297485 n=1 Tax=Actinia tenebrosa TaxID=6105 RepID=A0A6P8I1D1_ACTTE|nr:uncharacterized protein LOC116297485 [Actinia tenebrosa]XP_031561568.1 uncharacterized protein LOC116297485 [Actinia tenebrosa]XP_031561569.1 uncharacterized protein LOC116297485 [Actinia tenebrosa]XP_031561570.1 uncharacterized protein LOC116297485 [Actinia tenebrosa]XP_031561571.1 uncharacterized protein LOC116297485 [Actinia tenebrosa]XP_031561573.1 uncharacterized protein LOC116297485 [Actinia tenebrosa]